MKQVAYLSNRLYSFVVKEPRQGKFCGREIAKEETANLHLEKKALSVLFGKFSKRNLKGIVSLLKVIGKFLTDYWNFT